MSTHRGPADTFEKARAAAAALLLSAALAVITGCFLDWVTITEQPDVLPTEATAGPGTRQLTEPFNGMDTGDGKFLVAGSVILLALALLLHVRKKSLYGWLAFLTSFVMGIIGIADYRGIAGETIELKGIDVIGKTEPALGITLVAAGCLIGLIAALIGVAGSPRETD
ncbi:MAG: hypothetical protein H0U53_00990 [Actinobacteria bacterium]|nr:hypothetical protein [Actinomycetota bacterium]